MNQDKHLFFYTQDDLKTIAVDVVRHAKLLGASDSIVEVSETDGLSVSVRCEGVETIEHHHDKLIVITIFLHHHQGTASTSDFSIKALKNTVSAAYNIARFTAEDPCAGLTEFEFLQTAPKNLDLFHYWNLDVNNAVKIAQKTEHAAFATDKRITNSEGSVVSTQYSHFILATSNNFLNGFSTSQHYISCSPIASFNGQMQRDNWYSLQRNADQLSTAEDIGHYAAKRTLSRLGGRSISTRKCPVLFEAPLASGLISLFVQAISGGVLYKNMTFLANSLGSKIFAEHINIIENPYELGGYGSAPFDAEGVKTLYRHIVSQGIINGYFLSTYSARKLNMTTTGNAGGAHNIYLKSSITNANDNFDEMLRKLHKGLLVTDLIGNGINLITGSYSRGASGYWVEDGIIQFPVEEITIAGNLSDIFANIIAVGADTITRGNYNNGSVLIEEMTVAGYK